MVEASKDKLAPEIHKVVWKRHSFCYGFWRKLKKTPYFFHGLSLNCPWILNLIFREFFQMSLKSLNLCQKNPWKMVKMDKKSLKSPWIFLEFGWKIWVATMFKNHDILKLFPKNAIFPYFLIFKLTSARCYVSWLTLFV